MGELVKSCRSCEASIIWTVTMNGKRMPVDAEPVVAAQGFRLVGPDGELLDPEELGGLEPPYPITAAYTKLPESGEPLYLSHYATCPQAATWRR